MSFFSPAVHLANNISFTKKLLVVILCFFIPCVLVLIRDIQHQQLEINAGYDQLEGIGIANELKILMVNVAKHRGNMAQFLSGDASKKNLLKELESDTETNFKKMTSLISQSRFNSQAVIQIEPQWQAITLAKIGSDTKSSFVSHTALITSISHLLEQIISFYSLELSNTTNRHHLTQLNLLIIPSIQELTGQLRGKGAGALVDKLLTKDELSAIDSLHSGILVLTKPYQYSTNHLSGNFSGWTDIKNLHQQFESNLTTFINATQNLLNNPESPSISNSDYFASGTKAIESVGKLDQVIGKLLTDTAEVELTAAIHYRNWEIFIALLALASGCYLAMGVLIALNTSVKQLNFSTEKLKMCDFRHPPQVDSHDVIGEVGDHLTQVIDQVVVLLSQIKQSAEQVNFLAADVQTATTTVRNELDQQNNQTIQAASASTEMAATVREVARNCVEASNATDAARMQAIEGESKVKEAIFKINKLGEDVGIAQQNIGYLQDDVSSISAVLEVIRSIAEQTNLLALNAAIEAARAGEQGRGFAVVADEVRSLAKRTQDSTSEIKTVIERLQQRAQHAVSIINQSYIGAQESVVSAASAGNQLSQIVRGVSLMSDYNTQIATAAEEQAATAEQMSRNTRQLSDSAEAILKQVFNTQAFAQTLMNNANNLHQGVLKFKI